MRYPSITPSQPIHFVLTVMLMSSLFTSQLNAEHLPPTPASLFDIEADMEISIAADFGYLINNREVEELPAEVIISWGEDKMNLETTIEVRGNFRRDIQNCDFPPLRLRFKDKDIEETILEGNQSIKIVTHCKENSKTFMEFIGKEYTVYKLYNIISPYSLAVKMVEITYVDVKNQLKPIKNQAFLIEDIDHLADRHDMEEYEGKVMDEDLEQQNLLRVAVFEFMIGNTDWIVEFAKNLKFIRDDERLLAVPYDFDYTAIVDADYTMGGGGIPLMTPERKFKGPCVAPEQLETEFQHYRSNRDNLLREVDQSPWLRSSSRKEMIAYIESFYDIINTKNKVARYFFVKCE